MSEQNGDTKVRVERSRYTEAATVTVFKTETVDQVGALAYGFLERWGLVAAVEDGEDSAGRQKLRLPTPSEVVTRAFDIAEAATAEARKRGHMIALPDLNVLNAEADAKAAAKALVSTFNDLTKEVKEAWSACPPDQEYPLSRLHKWSKETPALQKKALANYQAGDEPTTAGDGEGGEGESGDGDEGRRIDGKRPGKRAVQAEIEKIDAKLEDKPTKEDAARLEGMKKALRWSLGEIVRLF
jgi:hypothetical protein